MESERLSGGNDSDEIMAGISRLEQFGEFTIIDQLAGGDILKYHDVLLMDMYTVITKLHYTKEQAEFDKRYSKVLRKSLK